MKTCNYCHATLVPKTFTSGKLEQPAQVRNRNYCDSSCHAAEVQEKKKLKAAGNEAIDKFCFNGWRL